MPVPAGTPPQSISDRAKASLLDLAESQVRTGLSEFSSAATDLPAFLAGPRPTSPAALPLYGITRAACRSYARGFGPQNLPGFDSVWGGICDPYLDSIGEKPLEGSIGEPFEGGQCAGVLYVVTFQYNLILTNGESQEPPVVATSNAIGPIAGIRGQGTPEFQNIVIDSGIGPDFARTGSCVQGCFRNISIVSIARGDGQPDSCGSPPPIYRPPVIAPGLPVIGPQPVEFPGIGPVDVDVTFGPDGEINIDFPGIDGDVTIGNPFEPGGEPGTDNIGPGEAGSPVNSGVGGDAEGEAGPGEELVGVQVEVLQTSENVNTFDNVADVVYRGIGYVRMGYPGRLGLDISGGTVLAPQFFHAQQRGLTAWAVRANLGFILRVTPYYRSLEQ